MKAYLVDPEEQTVSQVDVDDSNKSIYAMIEADMFDAVRLEHDDTLYVDDMGLYHKHHYFRVEGLAAPLAGRGLVLGTDSEGYSIEPIHTLEEFTALVTFITYDEALAMARQVDLEGQAREEQYRRSGAVGYVYFPIAGILEDAAYTDPSD